MKGSFLKRGGLNNDDYVLDTHFNSGFKLLFRERLNLPLPVSAFQPDDPNSSLADLFDKQVCLDWHQDQGNLKRN